MSEQDFIAAVTALDLLAGTHNQKDRAQAMSAILKSERIAALKRAEEICRERENENRKQSKGTSSVFRKLEYIAMMTEDDQCADAIRKEIERENAMP